MPIIFFLKWVRVGGYLKGLFCTVNLVALDPSTPHGEGLEATGQVLDGENPIVNAGTLIGLATLVFDYSYFEFNDTFYRQRLATAIGAKFATLANLFMTGLVEGLLSTP